SDVGRAGMNPLTHYLYYGLSEGRKPHLDVVANILALAPKDSNLATSVALSPSFVKNGVTGEIAGVAPVKNTLPAEWPDSAAHIPAKRASMAVVGWDLGHNPAGRAYVLADLARCHFDAEMVGPCFPVYRGNKGQTTVFGSVCLPQSGAAR
ncbi:MAG: hypothetical protein OEM98_11935, partial [Gammaproteobacteria bacterium]|nr:hypothetical protein [Gammaproteobacteria bacterium]